MIQQTFADTQDNTTDEQARLPIILTAGSCCSDCEIRATLVDLRWRSNYWKSRHKAALIREAHLKEEVENLEVKLRYLTQQLYGRKTEQRFSSESTGVTAAKRRRGHQHGQKGHGRRSYSHLPCRETVLSLAPDACYCSRCGLPFNPFPNTENSEEIVIDVQAYRRILRRRRYTPICACPCNPGIITAPLPAKLIPRSKIDLSIWVHILVEKYHYQRPLNRILGALSDFGASIPVGTVCDGLKRISPLFEPIREAIHEKSLQEKWWHADETRWMVVEMTEEKRSHRWYVWVFVSSSTVVYVLAPGRGADVVDEFFDLVEDGFLCVDRYSAYKCFVKTRNGFVLVFCWTHVRRDFLDIGRDWPKFEGWSHQWVARIGELFHLNKKRIKHPFNSTLFYEADVRLRKALQDMSEQRDKELNDPALHTVCRRTLLSLRNHWQGLMVFVNHPYLPMDNSEAERRLRNCAVGRKNYYGSATIRSGYFTVTMFTLFQTLRLWKINIRTWLTDYLSACANNGGRPLADISTFLPWNMPEKVLANFRNPSCSQINSS